MKHLLQAGTDAAALLLFDPRSLPDDFDTADEDRTVEVLESLRDAGRILWIDSGGDGTFLLQALVNELPSDEFQPYLRDPETANAFTVTSGVIYFVGAEHVFRADESPAPANAETGSSLTLANGAYEVTVYRTDFPDNLLDESFHKQTTPFQFRLHRAFSWVMAATILAVLIALGSPFFVSWDIWLKAVLPIAIGAVFTACALSRIPAFRQASEAWRRVQRQFPNLVATLCAKQEPIRESET